MSFGTGRSLVHLDQVAVAGAVEQRGQPAINVTIVAVLTGRLAGQIELRL